MQESNVGNRRCKYCSSALGEFQLFDKSGSRPYLCKYFSKTPWKNKLRGSEHYRIMCVQCFISKFGRLPLRPNTANGDYIHLLECVTIEDLNSINATKALTRENFIRKYGEAAGIDRWNKYRALQAESNKYEYKRDKHGMTPEEFDRFNASRSTTKANLIARHGEVIGNEMWDAYIARQKYTKSLKYFQDKYGADAQHKWNEINSKKAFTLDNYILKYGESGRDLFLSRIMSMSGGYSLVSQEFFDSVCSKLPPEIVGDSTNIMYATRNKEFATCNSELSIAYFYDFVIRNVKYAIEFNGEHCHPNETTLSDTEWKSWRCFGTQLTADEKHSEDVIKCEYLRKLGFTVDIVWFNEYTKNPDRVVNFIVERIISRAKELQIAN